MPGPITFSTADIDQAPVTFSATDIQPDFKQSDTSPNEVDPNTIGTLVRHLWTGLNPISAGQLLPFPKSAGGSGMDNPLLPANMASQMYAVKKEADAAWEKGDKVTAAAKYVESVIPLLGPWMSKQGNQLVQGKYAAAAGDMGAMAVSAALPQVAEGVRSLTNAVKGTDAAQALADTADEAATNRVTSVIAPRVGPNKLRFGNQAEQVAPAVARQTTGLTPTAVADSIATNFENATAQLDAAHDARLVSQQVPTDPIVKGLDAQISRLTAQPVEASQVTPKVTNLTSGGEQTVLSEVQAQPFGKTVTPAPNTSELSTLQKMRQEVSDLGPVAPYESVRRIREAWDKVARVKYMPSTATDVLKAQGEATGAVKGTAAMRDALGTADPTTAAANANYALWKTAKDVSDAAEETARSRPTVGRTMLARGLGAAVGGAADGAAGAVVGGIVGPIVERIANNAAPVAKMFAAKGLAKLADAIRRGNPAVAQQTLTTLRQIVPAAVVHAALPGAPPAASLPSQ